MKTLQTSEHLGKRGTCRGSQAKKKMKKIKQNKNKKWREVADFVKKSQQGRLAPQTPKEKEATEPMPLPKFI